MRESACRLIIDGAATGPAARPPYPAGMAIDNWETTMTEKRVDLDVRYVRAEPGDGFIDAGHINGRDYCYKYTGGDDGAGKLSHLVNRGEATITIHLVADPRYRFGDIRFTGDHAVDPQLRKLNHGERAHVFHNKNTKEIDAQYKITVVDTGNGNAMISCDPPIINKQPVT